MLRTRVYVAHQLPYVLFCLLAGPCALGLLDVPFHLEVMVVEPRGFRQRNFLIIAALCVSFWCVSWWFACWIVGFTHFDLTEFEEEGLVGVGLWMALSSFESVSVTSLL